MKGKSTRKLPPHSCWSLARREAAHNSSSSGCTNKGCSAWRSSHKLNPCLVTTQPHLIWKKQFISVIHALTRFTVRLPAPWNMTCSKNLSALGIPDALLQTEETLQESAICGSVQVPPSSSVSVRCTYYPAPKGAGTRESPKVKRSTYSNPWNGLAVPLLVRVATTRATAGQELQRMDWRMRVHLHDCSEMHLLCWKRQCPWSDIPTLPLCTQTLTQTEQSSIDEQGNLRISLNFSL